MKKFLLIGCLFLTGNALANTDPVDELFQTMSMEEQFSNGFNAMLPVIDQLATRLKLNPAQKEELRAIYKNWFDQDIDRKEVMGKLKKIYKATFSAEEMAAVSDFYKTAAGRKFLRESPRLMQVGAKAGMEAAQAKQAELMARLKPFMERVQKK